MIEDLLSKLPGSSLDYGGSHGGKLYQDYPWAPLDVLPAHRTSTAHRLAFILSALPDGVNGKRVLDVGCANGALTIGLAKAGADATGWDVNQGDLEIARWATSQYEWPHFNVPRFGFGDIAVKDVTEPWNVILYLSVWKWVVRQWGLKAARNTLRTLAWHSGTLLFESGITGTGIDLVDVKPEEIEPMLSEEFPDRRVELVGTFPRDEMNVDRPLWKIT